MVCVVMVLEDAMVFFPEEIVFLKWGYQQFLSLTYWNSSVFMATTVFYGILDIFYNRLRLPFYIVEKRFLCVYFFHRWHPAKITCNVLRTWHLVMSFIQNTKTSVNDQVEFILLKNGLHVIHIYVLFIFAIFQLY